MARSHSEEFISYLQKLAGFREGQEQPEEPNRAALAALRRGLSGNQSDMLRAFRYVGPMLPQQKRAQGIYILVAGLFALHPQVTSVGNMGCHLGDLRDMAQREEEKSHLPTMLDKRLAIMLQTRSVHLPTHLRRMVTFLKADKMPINWGQLLRDLGNWDDPRGFVQCYWAQAFWGPKQTNHATPSISKNQ